MYEYSYLYPPGYEYSYCKRTNRGAPTGCYEYEYRTSRRINRDEARRADRMLRPENRNCRRGFGSIRVICFAGSHHQSVHKDDAEVVCQR